MIRFKTILLTVGIIAGTHGSYAQIAITNISGRTTTSLNGENSLIVKVNNKCLKHGLPGSGYDWFNYGGITRDVNLVEIKTTFIEDYSIQLEKHAPKKVSGWVHIHVKIPELKIDYKTVPNLVGVCPWSLVDYRSLGRMHIRSIRMDGIEKGFYPIRGEKESLESYV